MIEALLTLPLPTIPPLERTPLVQALLDIMGRQHERLRRQADWLGDHQLRVREDVPLPSRPGEALVKVRLAGVCRTDLERVKGYYPFTGVLGHEFVGEVVRSPETVHAYGEWVGSGCARGTLVLKSTYQGHTPVNLSPVVVDEITIVGSRCGPFPPALRLLEKKAVDPTVLIAAQFGLTDSILAFEEAGQPNILKVLVKPNE